MTDLSPSGGGGRGGVAWLVGTGVAGVTAALGAVLLMAPSNAPDLAGLVNNRLAESGVSNPVTAVLLNFRAYDTLLEVGVLVVALFATWALGIPARHGPPAPGPVLRAALRWLAPAAVLIAGYLLWRGAAAPGGAFQAGSVLAALGVVLLVAGLVRGTARPWLRLVMSVGLIVFTAIGIGLMAIGDGFLAYRAGDAKTLILVIEVAAAISIGAILAALFLGGQPVDEERR